MLKKDKNQKFLLKLGQELRKIRQERNWSLEETENQGWSSWRHLQKIEKGGNFTVSTLLKLSKLYNIPISDIFKDLSD